MIKKTSRRLILAGVTINLAVNNQGIFNKAKTATRAYKNASEEEQTELNEIDKEIESYLPGVRYKDETGVKLDWYLFDVDETEGKAYLVSTPTYWVPDTEKEVRGAWVPKLVSSADSKTGAMNQAIQKKDSATSGNYSYSYDSSKVNYNPKETTLNYFKSVNSDWAKSENGR